MKRPWMRNIGLGLLLVAGLGLSGCATRQYERHYFAAAELEPDHPVVKFYRITIKAKSRNMKTDYKAGFYNADAVRSLFGEVKKDDASGGTTQRAGTYTLALEGGRWSVVNQDTLFTIVYGTDAQAITQQINAFASSAENAAAFSRLLGAAVAGDAVLEIDEVSANAIDVENKKKLVAEQLNNMAAALDGGTNSSAELEERLRSAAVIIANVLGASSGIAPLPDSADVAAVQAFIQQVTDALLKKNV